MRRAELRLIRERLELALADLLGVEYCGCPDTDLPERIGRTKALLEAVIARLPDAAANAGRAERLANENRRLGGVAPVIPTDGSQFRS